MIEYYKALEVSQNEMGRSMPGVYRSMGVDEAYKHIRTWKVNVFHTNRQKPNIIEKKWIGVRR